MQRSGGALLAAGLDGGNTMDFSAGEIVADRRTGHQGNESHTHHSVAFVIYIAERRKFEPVLLYYNIVGKFLMEV